MKRIVKVLDNKDCVGDNLFFEVSSKLYELEPAALSASKMGKMSISRGEYNQAIKYCKEAIDLEQDPGTKAKYYLGLADAYRNLGSFSNSRSAVYEALN